MTGDDRINMILKFIKNVSNFYKSFMCRFCTEMYNSDLYI